MLCASQQIRNEKKTFLFEAQSQPEREEWLRALTHCISGSSMPNMIDMRRRSINNATLAPVFMFNKVSNVCTICYHPFAVYRPRHHCRYAITYASYFSHSLLLSPQFRLTISRLLSCRLCGCLVCGTCSKRKWTLAYSSSKKPSRVCDNCAKTNSGITGSLDGEAY